MKILIIKLGALGDVVRTLPLAKAIKEEFSDSEICWITRKGSLEIVRNSPYVDKAEPLPFEPKGKFDILYNFDIDDEATELAAKLDAAKKLGFYSDGGYPAAFNEGAEYYLNTIFDDSFKRENRKTYQEMMFDVAELNYKKQHHEIVFSEEHRKYAEEFTKKNNLNSKKLIGIHIGSSPRWPSKAWNTENIIDFITNAKGKEYEVILFSGPDDIEKQKKILDSLNEKGIKVHANNPFNSLSEFFSLISLCNAVVCSDSLAIHISLALKKPTIGLFFVTSPHEIEDYGILTKLISPRLKEFFPEKMDKHDEELTKSISADDVLEALETTLESKPARVVNAIVKHPDEEKFLLIKRKNEEMHKGKWAFPGGVVEKNETTGEALSRELEEETGLELCRIIRKVAEYSYERPDGKKTFGESYLVTVKNFNVKEGEEIDDIRWVTLEELERMEHIEGIEEEAMNALYT